MGFPLRFKNKRVVWILLVLYFLITLSAVMILANQEDQDAPAIDIRHEAVTYHNGFSVYRMIVSARAPNGFGLFGIVMSYDNSIIQPIHSTYFSDITSPTNTTVRPGNVDPFYTLISGFIEAPSAWLVQEGRTGFSFDVFSLNEGVTTDEMTDIFAFYYRAHANNIEAAPDAFRIEDGRIENSMVGTDSQASFVRSGIIMRSLDTTYVWGAAFVNPTYSLIPDRNVDGFYGEVLALEVAAPESTQDDGDAYSPDEPQYPYETLNPDPYTTPEPGTTSTPNPSTPPSATSEPSSSPSATPAPSTTPSATPTPSTAPSATPTPCPTTPCPPPSAGPPDATRPNPATNPLAISFLVFGAVTLTGIASVGIIAVAKKHKSSADTYNTALTRHNRESRLSDILDEK